MNQTINKWAERGFLDGIDDSLKESLATAYEITESYITNFPDEEEFIEKPIFPAMRKIFSDHKIALKGDDLTGLVINIIEYFIPLYMKNKDQFNKINPESGKKSFNDNIEADYIVIFC
jgi:hypothetical protein